MNEQQIEELLVTTDEKQFAYYLLTNHPTYAETLAEELANEIPTQTETLPFDS